VVLMAKFAAESRQVKVQRGKLEAGAGVEEVVAEADGARAGTREEQS